MFDGDVHRGILKRGQEDLDAEFLKNRLQLRARFRKDAVFVTVLVDHCDGARKVERTRRDFEFQDPEPAQETTGLFLLRIIKNFFRRALFVNEALVHVKHAAGHFPGKLHLMRHDHHGFLLPRQFPDDALHLADAGRVQGAGRLVKEDDIRVHGEGPGNGDALLLSAGHLVGVVHLLFCQADHPQQFHRPVVCLLPAQMQQLYRCEHHVLNGGHVAEQVIRLEDHAHFPAHERDVAALRRDILAVQENLPRSRALQQVHAVEQGGFSRAGRADNGDDIPVVDDSVNIPERNGVPVFFSQMPDLNHVLRSP